MGTHHERRMADASLFLEPLRAFICLSITVALGACASNSLAPCKGYSPAAKALKHQTVSLLSGDAQAKYDSVQEKIMTNKTRYYHEAAIAYPSFESPFSFYLLGFEKPRQKDIDRPYCRPSEKACTTPKFDPGRFHGSPDDDQDEVEDTRKDIEKNLFGDPRFIVLTHILNVRKTGADGGDDGGCFVFDLYGDESTVPWCEHSHRASIHTREWTRQGWRGLDGFADDIRERAARERATHIIVLASGWNTRQYESYLDFRAWMEKLGADFTGEEFRPIFVGVTWESEWPLWEKIPFISEFTKGNDADEMGYAWANYLVNDLLKPIARESGAQLAVIGHSFGSRIALGSHYVRDILVRTAGPPDMQLTLIGLQAAFPVARFVSAEGKEHQYLEANRGLAKTVISSSAHDSATGTMCIGTAYVGAGCGLAEVKADPKYRQFVSVLPTQDNGDLGKVPDPKRVSVYEASSFVNCELEGTQSGAHSDVYDDAIGHFLGSAIRASAKQQ